MNEDDDNLHPWIDPDLEARVVAWVLGEASAFEVAELERLLSKNPELALFKSRIEVVHELASAASRPGTPRLRLAPDRRRKLLAVLNSGAEEPAPPKVRVFEPRPAWLNAVLIGRVAACLLIVGVGVTIFLSITHVGPPSGDIETARRASETNFPAAPASAPISRTTMESATSAHLGMKANAPLDEENSLKQKEKVPAAHRRGTTATATLDLAKAIAMDRVAPQSEAEGVSIFDDSVATMTAEISGSGGQSVGMASGRAAPVESAELAAAAAHSNNIGSSAIAEKPVDRLLREGGNFYQTGHYDLATKRGEQALNLDKSNLPARRLLEKVNASREEYANATFNETRSRVVASVHQAWELPAKKPARGKDVANVDSAADMPMSEATNVLATKEYKVSPGFIRSLSADGLGGVDGKFDAKKFLETMGVSFPAGASASYLTGSDKIVIRNTHANIDLMDQLVDVDTLTPPEEAAAFPPAELKANDQPFSTFSLHVADVSFLLAKDAFDRGEKPDPSRIRPEEFYNAFDYGDPAPAAGESISCRIEQSAHPFRQQRNLVRIAMKVASSGRAASQPLRLTILLDTSGSMEREDRAASVRRALAALAPLLGPQDRVTLVGFARQPRLLAEQLPGDQAKKLVEIAGRTPSDGGTNLEAALDLASELALKQRDPAAQNRIVLLTDGAANLGNAKPAELARRIEALRQQGIAFDACGVGADGLNDEVLEALTRKGDGRYYFLNQPDDADAGFAKRMAGALRPAAENVKVQVRFNPARVGGYRLIGFDEHRLEKEDFRNDRVDAAELSAEEAAVALYQIEPLPDGEGELGEVFVRFRDAATGAMVERSWTLPYEAQAPAFDRASSSMQLAGVAASLGEKLRGDDEVDLKKLAPVVTALRGSHPQQPRVRDLLRMFDQTAR